MNDETRTCSELRDRIPLYVGGDLDGMAQEDVRRHLASCEACAAESTAARTAREAFRSTLSAGARDMLTPSPDLWVGVRASLVAEGLFEGRDTAVPREPTPALEPRPAARRRLRIVRYASGLAAAAAVVVFATLGEFGLETNDVVGPGPEMLADTGPALLREESGMRRIAPDEERPLAHAEKIRLEEAPSGTPWMAPGQNALAGEKRRTRRFR